MTIRGVASVFVLLALSAMGLVAQSSAPANVRYLTPPQPIVDILEAPPIPLATVSPTRDTIALAERRSMPPIAELAQPMLRLAGERINPRTDGPHRTPGILGFTFKNVATGAEHKATVPAAPTGGSTLLAIGYAPDGKRFAFGRIADTGIELWMADVATGRASRLGTVKLNATAGNVAGGGPGGRLASPCAWLQDGSALACATVPASRGPAPVPPTVPEGPNVQETSGKPAPVRTYEDLLASAHDEALFEYYFTSQLALIDPASGQSTPVGKPGLFEGEVKPSPNGAYFLIERTRRPFSRLAPRDDFPKDVEIWSRTGQKVRTIADVPSGESVSITGVITGPRKYRWQPKQPATIVWAEALDEGNLKNKVPYRDRVVALAAPFAGEPREVIKTEFRFTDIDWTDQGIALVTEFDRPRRWTRTWVLDAATGAPNTPTAAPRKLWDRSREDAYANPGTPLERGLTGAMLQHGQSIYLTGVGASAEGERPFLDRLDLTTLKTERLWHCDASSYETITGLLSDDGTSVLTRRESHTDPPNYMVRTLPGEAHRALTSYKDPAPQLAGVQKRLIKYKRNDGLDLSATLYLPAGYKEGTRLPMVMWAYPREFTSAAGAGQVTGSANRFTTVSGPSHLLLLTQGYAILDDPKIPIVGAGETANDTYVEQLVAGAQAAVDAVVALGVADRDRIGIGGHSYGAFMTANLLAHSDLFRMGIARSGAYNRTLTPFGFQAETRTFWDVPQIYAQMSPFYVANKINEPILLIHGEADDNSGTFPIQTERLYMAIKGNGGTARYVTLPYEAHGYAGRETVLHVVTEMLNWSDKYLKQATPRQAPAPTTSSAASAPR
jgi:dipeptidyl aminopeptidase/acylaminoacyl peptidase